MQPDSLVFVVIVAAWAAYLLPRWVVRRDALGQHRGRDRHSVHMRVLQRRRRRPVGPSSRPLLTPKPASARHSLGTPSPTVASPTVASPAAASPTPVPVASPKPAPRPGPILIPRQKPKPGSKPVQTAHGRPADRAAARPAPGHSAAGRKAAARRARVLLLLATAVAASWTVVLLTSVPGWAGAPASGLLVLDLVALVTAGRRRAAARRAVARDVARRTATAGRRIAAAQAASRVAEAAAALADAPAGAAAREAQATIDHWNQPTFVERRMADRRRTPRGTPDRRAGVAASVGPGRPARRSAASSRPDTRENTWVPVAVPPPTYTLKPVVHRPEPRPLDLPVPAAAPASGPVGVPTPAAWADDLDLDAVLARRRAVNG